MHLVLFLLRKVAPGSMIPTTGYRSPDQITLN